MILIVSQFNGRLVPRRLILSTHCIDLLSRPSRTTGYNSNCHHVRDGLHHNPCTSRLPHRLTQICKFNLFIFNPYNGRLVSCRLIPGTHCIGLRNTPSQITGYNSRIACVGTLCLSTFWPGCPSSISYVPVEYRRMVASTIRLARFLPTHALYKV